MILIYLGMDGTARLEKTKINARWIEEPDGYHPKTADSIWHDVKRGRDAIMIIAEGVTPPIGAAMAHNDIVSIFAEQEIKEPTMKRTRVSKMWARGLYALGEWFFKYGWFILIFGMVAYSMLNSFASGGS